MKPDSSRASVLLRLLARGVTASRGTTRRSVARFASLSVGAALAPGVVHASGFHIDEQDARATGRAGAVIASANNASAIYYNPAGIAELDGVHVDIGGALVRPNAEFTSAEDGATTGVNTDNVLIPQAFVSWRINPSIAVGIGAYAPFGLRLDWPASSPGRTNIRQADLRTFFITPAVAVNLSSWVPGLSLGAGPDLVPASVRLDRDILFGTDVGTVAIDGSAFGIGGRVGISYRPPSLPAFAVGLSYRSPVALDFSGEGDFDAPLAYRGSLPPDGDVETSVTLPQSVNAGFLVSPVPGLEFELDVNWRGWSSYDKLEADLPDGSVDRQAKDWHDSFTLRLGGEYIFDERWAVRAGGVWDQAPVPSNRLDFQVPDVDRVDLSLGFGARVTEQLSVDLGALYVLPRKRRTGMSDPLEPPVKGRFEVDVIVISLSVGIQLETMAANPDAALDTAAAGEPCGLSRGEPAPSRPDACLQ
jgi:long-chain fatty acid transport protein